jgi:hypothetical protein
MAAAIDTGNIQSSSNASGTPASFNVTCGASDNFLVVVEADFFNTTIASSAQNTSTGVWTTATQSWAAGQAVCMVSGGIPGGFSGNTVYYVLATNLSATTAELSATQGGSVIVPSSSSGTAALVEMGPPTSMTYNSVGMTLQSSYAYAGGSFPIVVSVWYLATPPTGAAHQVAFSYLTSPAFAGLVAIPMSGVNTSAPFGTAANNASTSSSNASVTATGAGANDLYLACAVNGTQTMMATGANQTNLAAINGLGGSPNSSISADTVPGVDAGVFSWTGSGTLYVQSWAALGIAVKGLASGTASIAWVS